MHADVAGWTGDDEPGARLRELLGLAGVRVQGVEVVRGRPTTTKTRVLSGQQQLVRIDDEDTTPRPAAARAGWDDRVVELLDDGYEALVLSDYAKGVIAEELCRRLIARARQRGIPVLVDPKGMDYGKYRGATTITPNETELAATTQVSASDSQELIEAAIRLRELLSLDFLTLTRGEAGISLIDPTGTRHVPARAREVFDVSGAGDTAIATLAAGVAAGLDSHDAAVLANLAAGIIVGKTGTVPIQQQELLGALGPAVSQLPALDEKIVSLESAVGLVSQWRSEGHEVGFTNGCFDIVHAGHVTYLDWARRNCDRLVVALNTDRSVRELKGPGRPVNAEAARVQVLSGLAAVDAIVCFDEPTPLAVIEALRPDVLIKGEDYAESDIVGGDEVRSWGGRVLRAPLMDGFSTTSLLDRLGSRRD